MFAFGHPTVLATDIVATVDVNMFISTNKFLDPIFDQPNLLAWIYQVTVLPQVLQANFEHERKKNCRCKHSSLFIQNMIANEKVTPLVDATELFLSSQFLLQNKL
jgi:hypothetical protein